ncbi:unnamed protein product [Prunus armeniaca]
MREGKINPPSNKAHTFVILATYYFTKWVEATSVKSISSYEQIDRLSLPTLINIIKKIGNNNPSTKAELGMEIILVGSSALKGEFSGGNQGRVRGSPNLQNPWSGMGLGWYCYPRPRTRPDK